MIRQFVASMSLFFLLIFIATRIDDLEERKTIAFRNLKWKANKNSQTNSFLSLLIVDDFSIAQHNEINYRSQMANREYLSEVRSESLMIRF